MILLSLFACKNPTSAPQRNRDDANLTSLTIRASNFEWPITPEFSESQTEYRVQVPLGTRNLQLIPSFSSPQATLPQANISGTSATNESLLIQEVEGRYTVSNLNRGENTLRAQVLAENGTTTKEYTLVIDVSLNTVSVSGSSSSVNEGSSVMIDFTIDEALTEDVQIQYIITGLTNPDNPSQQTSPAAWGDSTSTTGRSNRSTTIAANSTSRRLTIPAVNDTEWSDFDGGFTITIDSVRTTSGNPVQTRSESPSYTVYIIDNDAPVVSVSNPNSTVSEGQSTTFTVSLTNSDGTPFVPTQPVTINYSLEATGGATPYASGAAGEDWANPGSSLTIPANNSSGTVDINVNSDSVADQNEGFTFLLTDATVNNRALIIHTTNGSTSVGITDVNSISYSLSPTTVTEGNDIVITVSLARIYSSDVSLNYSVATLTSADGGTVDGVEADDYKTEDSDASSESSPVTIQAGDDSATITISTLDDSDSEATEWGRVTISFDGTIPNDLALIAAPLDFSITDND